MKIEQALPWLSLLVGVLTLWTLWESHRLHRLQLDDASRRRRSRGPWQGAGGGRAAMN